jgi:FixJ family two-component response regulator
MGDTGSRVAVIEDDESVRKSLRRLLRSVGFSVQTFASAEEYLKVELTTPPGCLIIDVRMPGLSGLELQQRLLRTGSRVPAIFMTAHEDPQARTQAQALGAVAFLQKPFDEKMLLAAIQVALGRTPDASADSP